MFRKCKKCNDQNVRHWLFFPFIAQGRGSIVDEDGEPEMLTEQDTFEKDMTNYLPRMQPSQTIGSNLGNNGNLQLANVVLSGAMGKEIAGLPCPAGGGSCSRYPSCGCSSGSGEGCCCGRLQNYFRFHFSFLKQFLCMMLCRVMSLHHSLKRRRQYEYKFV